MKLTAKRVLISAGCLLLAVGCNKAYESETAASAGKTAAAPVAAVESTGQAAAPASTSEEVLAGTELTLADGGKVEVLSVGKFDEAQGSLSGPVAIEGRVAETYPERGAIVLVDVDNMAGCSDNCCPQAQVPVKLDLAQYTGELPEAGKQVVVVGEIIRTELGYDLQVAEIRSEGETLVHLSSVTA